MTQPISKLFLKFVKKRFCPLIVDFISFDKNNWNCFSNTKQLISVIGYFELKYQVYLPFLYIFLFTTLFNNKIWYNFELSKILYRQNMPLALKNMHFQVTNFWSTNVKTGWLIIPLLISLLKKWELEKPVSTSFSLETINYSPVLNL